VEKLQNTVHNPETLASKPVVAVAGASGFVGTHLRQQLADSFHWRALTRSTNTRYANTILDETTWHHCDLFSPIQVEEALRGCRYALYLIHSMLPSSRLVQGSFEDMDLLLADNFARGAAAAGVEHIVYLGGLIPENPLNLSPHLASRLEVEGVLRSTGIPVTVLRAGLIFGPGGSSTRMLINLVRRLPFMLLPKWTRNQTGSSDVRDVLRAFRMVLQETNLRGGTYDLGTHRQMTYEDLILGAGKVLGRRPRVLHAGFDAISISRFWVRLFSGLPSSLVAPLMESLTHPLVARDNPVLRALRSEAIPFEQSVRDAVDPEGRPLDNPRKSILPRDRVHLRQESRVRSVQRMPLPGGWEAPRIAEAYQRWLSKSFLTALFSEQSADGSFAFVWRYPRLRLLELTPTPRSRQDSCRIAFYISGGLLARPVDPPGRFEFRLFPGNHCLIAAIHGFAPRLPWYLYEFSQAVVHLAVMRAFAAWLGKQPPEKEASGPTSKPSENPADSIENRQNETLVEGH
jgi:nucleoside-diphosphate-sugar epimerase